MRCIFDTCAAVSWNDLIRWQTRHCLVEVPDLWLCDSEYSYSSPSQMPVCKDPPPLPMTLLSLLLLLPRVAFFVSLCANLSPSLLAVWLCRSRNWDALGLRLIFCEIHVRRIHGFVSKHTYESCMQQRKKSSHAKSAFWYLCRFRIFLAPCTMDSRRKEAPHCV